MSDKLNKGNLTVRRYHVLDPLPASPRERIAKGIRAHAFLPIDPRGDIDKTSGWVSCIDEDDADLNHANLFFNAPTGEQVRITLRTDTLKPPPAEVKRRLKVQTIALEAKEGRKLSRREKRLLKEEVVRELRQKTLPKVALADAVWNLDTGRVWFFNQGKTACEAFLDLFAKSTGLRVVEEAVTAWAGEEVGGQAGQGKLNRLTPTRELWLGFPGARPLSTNTVDTTQASGGGDDGEGDGGDGAGGEDDEHDLAFLAREFLTWLVFHGEANGGAFDGVTGARRTVEPFTLVPFGRVWLRTPAGLVTDMAMAGPSPADSPDLRFALAGGLAVKEVELRLEQGEQVWRFALVASRFDLKRVKVPALLAEAGDDQAGERLALLERLDEAIKAAFGEFLRLRIGEDWTRDVVPAIREWLVEGIGGGKAGA